jgi:hypothetical protein
MNNLTKEQFDIIMEKVDEYNESHNNWIEYWDVVFTYFFPDSFLMDYDEWENNDPHTDRKWEYDCSEYRIIKEIALSLN